MPPRRKPTSTRQKRADQQLRRAIKRGDVPPQDVTQVSTPRKRKTGPTGRPIATSSDTTIESARRLQSAFVKVSQKFLHDTKVLASNIPLSRPVPNGSVVLRLSDQNSNDRLDSLTCPKRPKWRYDQSKLEVERNEEGIFKKWLVQTDEAIEKWQNEPSLVDSAMPRSTSYFERNLEVWRQLWRVAEISQIILVLLDSRCPLLHYPPGLSSYLGDRKVILVLTKVDISGPLCVQAWIKYFRDRYPNLPIVQVESYVEKEGPSDQGHKIYEPHIPEPFREKLVKAIKDVHAELLEPPERTKKDEERLKRWVPPVKRAIDWDAVLQAKGDRVGLSVGGAAAPRPKSPDQQEDEEATYLTIGVIGQPNVGKSSLLNALFGSRKVRASRTPGKTKHFQTLYWTADVRLVDCPGLVIPSYAPMEMQVLSGILPISRVSAISACIYQASELLPLEQIYNLVHPRSKLPPIEDKRTWREGMKISDLPMRSPLQWTAMDVLTAYADRKGWVTAKAGRPDVNRAGNAILRALAEGRVGWAFWPPDTSLDQSSTEGYGIWVPRGDGRCDPVDDGIDQESEEERHVSFNTEGEEIEVTDVEYEDEDEDEDDDDDDDDVAIIGLGRFGALALSDEENED